MPLGHKFSDETKKKMSESAKARGTGLWMKGRKHTEKWKKTVSEKLKGHKFSEETKQKIAKTKTGSKASDDTKKKMSDSQKRIGNKPPLHIGEKCHLWKGGITSKKYTIDWTNSLRISIRERDKYTCQICGEKQGDRAFSIHHIDYVKENCDPKNLTTLCVKCHAKTNQNRESWIEYFKIKYNEDNKLS